MYLDPYIPDNKYWEERKEKLITEWNKTTSLPRKKKKKERERIKNDYVLAQIIINFFDELLTFNI